MEIPKKIPISAFTSSEGEYVPARQEFQEWEYSHENPYFAEVAGHVFNRYLRVEELQEPSTIEVTFRFRFGSRNSNKAQLYFSQVVSNLNAIMRQDGMKIKEAVYVNAIQSLLEKSFDNTDTVHKLNKSFLSRLKYAFTKTI